jgi:arylsulfatase A-like enzyme
VRSPEPVAPTRGAALTALVFAALGLVAIESAYAWAERWHHAPVYFALSGGLTFALALGVGLVASVLSLAPAVALAAWAGLAFGFQAGWPSGLALLLLGLGVTRLAHMRRVPSAVLGTCAALALACAFLKSPAVAEHLGHEDDVFLEGLGATLLFAGLFGGLAFALARLPARVPSAVRVLALLVLACLAAQRPRFERGDGEQRRPPPDYARSAPRVEGPEKPDVYVLVLDTVRADHLSVDGYARETTPELARLLREHANAVVYPRAYANGTWTVPAHASLFTGRLPHEHGAHFALDGSVRVGFGIAEALPTLAQRMQEGGYATLAGYANHWLRSVQGMGRGFDRYLRAPDKDELPFVGEALRQRFLPGLLWEAAKGCARASDVNQTLLSMIEPWSAGPNPLFVFANYVDAHGPYAPPAPFRGRFAPSDVRERSEHLALSQSVERRHELMARYDEEIAYLDHELGRLFRRLAELGRLRRAWVFITADHGEAFGEHGVLEHGTSVHEEVVRVPLIVFPPEGVTLTPTHDPVSLVDVAATVAAIGGVELGGPGRDLRALGASGLAVTTLEFYGDPVKAATLGALAKRPARAVLVGRHKLIAYSDSVQLFDVEADPGELVDLSKALPNLVEHLRGFLPEFGEPTFRSDHEAPVPEALDALRGLGYAGGLGPP